MRIGLAAAILSLGLLGLRLVSGYVWEARFQAALQTIRDRGEPIDAEDFRVPLPDDADNAAIYLQRAISAWPDVPGTTQTITASDWFNDPDLHPDPITDNAGYLAACQPALDLVQRAAEAPASHWGNVPTSPVINSFGALNYFGESRRLARYMADASTRAMAAGQPERALEITRQIYHLARSLHGPPISLLDYLVALSIRAMAVGLIEEHLVSINAENATPQVKQELRRLIEMLADEQPTHAAFQNAAKFERMFNQDYVTALANNKVSLSSLAWAHSPPTPFEKIKTWLFKPLYFRDGVLMLDYWTRSIEAADPLSPEVYEQIDTDLNAKVENPWRSPLVSFILPGISATQRTQLQQTTNHRLAVTAIALKLYEIETGVAPASLDQLVPGYLEAVPIDPYDPAGGTIRYRPAGGKLVPYYDSWGGWLTDEEKQQIVESRLPLVYSVGRDGVDDGGVIGADQDGAPLDSSRYNPNSYDGPSDHWFLLAPRPEPIPDPNPPAFFGGYGSGF